MGTLSILTAFIVGLTAYVHSYSQIDKEVAASKADEKNEIQENFRDLLNSITINDKRKSETYRNILSQQALREQQVFDTLKEELMFARQEIANEQTNLHNQENGGTGGKVMAFKRAAKKGGGIRVSNKKGKGAVEEAVTKAKKQQPTTARKTTVTTAGTKATKTGSPRFHQSTTPRWRDVFDAATHNDTAAARHFLERDENLVKMVNEEDKTIALIAAENGNFDLLKYVLGKNGSTDLLLQPDIYGNTVLQSAIEKSSIETVKLLVEEYNWNVTEPNQRSPKNTPLHVAAEEGQLEILKYFIEDKKGDPNVRNVFGNPPAFLAADKTHLDIIKYLVEEGNADTGVVNEQGCNILFRSAKNGDVTVPKYLLDEKKVALDVNLTDSMNCTVVYTATRYAKYEFLHYIVTQHHPNLNIVDHNGRTALHIAAHQNNYAMCKFLIDNGASLEIKDAFNNTPVQVATDRSVRGFLDDMTNVLRRERAERTLRRRYRRNIPTCTTAAGDSI